jgi:hypothetical protein
VILSRVREPRADEVWARACIRAALGGVDVRYHDDGSRDGMYDLEVRTGDRVVAAVEVTSVLDAPPTVLWNLLNSDGRWIDEGLAGGWAVALGPRARAKRIKAELPAFLKMLEQTGVRHVLVGSRHPGPVEQRAARLGITDMVQSSTDFPGSIYPLHGSRMRRRLGLSLIRGTRSRSGSENGRAIPCAATTWRSSIGRG